MSFRKNSIADVLGSPSYASVAHLFYGNLAEKQVIRSGFSRRSLIPVDTCSLTPVRVNNNICSEITFTNRLVVRNLKGTRQGLEFDFSFGKEYSS